MTFSQEETWLLTEKYGGDATAEGFEDDRTRLALGEPLAYIVGWQPFLGLTIRLGSRPLIPRPETEYWVAELMQSVSGLRVLDLCAGSGAIGCALLARVPNVRVSFGDVDPAHQATIERNIRENNLDAARADIRTGDLFAPFAGEIFDVIAANPPYIPTNRALPASVAEHEPAIALRAGPDGLDLIRRIAQELPQYLSPGGKAWIECDQAHAESARKLFEHEGMKAELRTDQYGRPRVIVVRFS